MSDFKTVKCNITDDNNNKFSIMISGSYLNIYYYDSNNEFKIIDLENPSPINVNFITDAPPNPPIIKINRSVYDFEIKYRYKTYNDYPQYHSSTPFYKYVLTVTKFYNYDISCCC